MAQKPKLNEFGDAPVEALKVNEFGDAPVAQVQQEQPAYAPQQPQTIGRGLVEGLKALNPLPGLVGLASALPVIGHPIDTARNVWNAGLVEQGKAGEAFKRGLVAPRVNPLNPLSVLTHPYTEALGHGLASALPVIGPAAAAIGEQIGGTEPKLDKYGNVLEPGQPPDIVGGVPKGLAMVGSILGGPPAVRQVGRAVKWGAEPLVKTALRLPGKAEAYGATPARAVLQETGLTVRPSSIAQRAQQRMNALGTELESRTAASTGPATLVPARQVVSGRIAAAQAANSAATPAELAPLQRFLTEPQPGFQGATEYAPGANTPITVTPAKGLVGAESPASEWAAPAAPTPGRFTVNRGPAPEPLVATEQTPLNLLRMKRQFNTDFIRNWNPAASTKGALGVGRQAYGALAREFNRVVPGGEELNQRISSLVPVAERARLIDFAPSLPERLLSNLARPRGILPALAGWHFGGLPGVAAGLVGAESTAGAMPLMIAARTAYNTGRLVGSRAVQRGVQAAPLVRTRRPAEDFRW